MIWAVSFRAKPVPGSISSLSGITPDFEHHKLYMYTSASSVSPDEFIAV